jgi:hypothetical protein
VSVKLPGAIIPNPYSVHGKRFRWSGRRPPSGPTGSLSAGEREMEMAWRRFVPTASRWLPKEEFRKATDGFSRPTGKNAVDACLSSLSWMEWPGGVRSARLQPRGHGKNISPPSQGEIAACSAMTLSRKMNAANYINESFGDHLVPTFPIPRNMTHFTPPNQERFSDFPCCWMSNAERNSLSLDFPWNTQRIVSAYTIFYPTK